MYILEYGYPDGFQDFLDVQIEFFVQIMTSQVISSDFSNRFQPLEGPLLKVRAFRKLRRSIPKTLAASEELPTVGNGLDFRLQTQGLVPGAFFA